MSHLDIQTILEAAGVTWKNSGYMVCPKCGAQKLTASHDPAKVVATCWNSEDICSEFRRRSAGRRGINMKNTNSKSLDNLSNIVARLVEVEAEHVDNNDGGAHAARAAIVDALPRYRTSRFEFGKLLATYKAYYLEEGGWCEAAKVIAGALGCDERTIRRIIEDYERASQVPVEVLRELAARGVEPAAKKNAGMINNLVTMPSATVETDPERAVQTVVEAAAGAKAEEKAQAAEKRAAAKMAKAAKKPSLLASVTGNTEIVPLTTEERLRRETRMKIRTALTNVPDDRKLAELIAALEEEMFEVWGETVPKTITLTPHASALTLDGRRKQEVAA